MSDTFWVALGSIGSTLAFGAVAVQSYFTRKAVNVSQVALDVAHGTQVASEAVAIDAARARLDIEAPAMEIRVVDVPWPPLAWSHVGMPVSPWPPGYEWHFPHKQDERIVLQARIGVRNAGTRPMTVEFDGDLYVATPEKRARRATPVISSPQPVPPVNPNLYLQADFTIKELSENYEARAAGRPLPHRATGTITVHDNRDNGVTDVWRLEITGCPVRPDENRSGVWHVDHESGSDCLEYTAHPTYERTYWISRRNGQKLPVPTYGPGSVGPSEPPALSS
ncbi:hypothetical protein [Streptomyces sp. bgisy154]|uniref:hypothetical protein n=1 Tax=Streptomyces sp. bgisy154 TaxID=3413794 RepID=UPI003D7599DD